MEGLPFLPGNSFKDPTNMRYHRSQSLKYTNGYAVPLRPEVGIGGEAIVRNQLNEAELDELANFHPTLTYGQAKKSPPNDYVPSHVALDKKVLRFNGYFTQSIIQSPDETFRVRPVELFYYLEDDTIAVVEPHVENSGMPQGKLIKRQKLPKDDDGGTYHWKDINNSMNLSIYSKIFRIVSCDAFTQNFLESEGIIVNPPESIPKDPYIEKRKQASALKTFSTPSSFDKTRQFLELDRKVLRMFCLWDDQDSMFGEMRPFILHYYLVDDTLEIREVHKPNDGRDPFPVLIGRHKVPKNRSDIKPSFPLITMEITDHEIQEYFSPKDFMVGKTVTIYGRRFLIYDCDNFTKSFYYHNFGVTEFPNIDVTGEAKELPKMEIPPYNNFGSMEDSIQSCLSLVPQPPKKDFIKMLQNDHKVLRFEAVMDSNKPEDRGRRFILAYRLADDMMTIFEPPVRNSGIIGGKFLERTRVAKPGSQPDKPEFYGPQDFYIGAVVDVFKHRFVITSADQYVLNFMEEHSEQFPPQTIESLRQKLGQTRISEDGRTVKGGPLTVRRSPGDLQSLVSQVRAQLKKIAITDKSRVDEMFLRYDTDRTGYIDANNMRDLCRRLQLPTDDDVIIALVSECTENVEGHINLEEFRRFVESS